MLYFTEFPPTNIRFPVEHITDVSFVVQWDAVISQSVISYVLTWTDGTNPIQTVTVNETSYNVTGLTPNTTYTIIVAATNRNCTGPYSTNHIVTLSMNSVTTTTTTSSATITSITTSPTNTDTTSKLQYYN